VESARALIEDALALEAAGIQMLLLEAIPPEVGKFIAEKLSIPALSIGAGMHCDGQLLIVSDLIGQFQAFTPKFVKKYCDVAGTVTNALKEYCAEVRAGTFPTRRWCRSTRRRTEPNARLSLAPAGGHPGSRCFGTSSPERSRPAHWRDAPADSGGSATPFALGAEPKGDPPAIRCLPTLTT
jgi:hypothetical protein